MNSKITLPIFLNQISDFTFGGSRLSYTSWAKSVDLPPKYKRKTIKTPYSVNVIEMPDSTISIPEDELPTFFETIRMIQDNYGIANNDILFLELQKKTGLVKGSYINLWSMPDKIIQKKGRPPIPLSNFEWARGELDTLIGHTDYAQILGPVISGRREDPVRRTYHINFRPPPYTRIKNIGYLNVPEGSSNVISYEDINDGTNMVNFEGEYKYGHYYTKNTFNRLSKNNKGFKTHPQTRGKIKNNATLRKYKARIVPKKKNTLPVAMPNISILPASTANVNINSNNNSNTNNSTNSTNNRTSRRNRKTRKNRS